MKILMLQVGDPLEPGHSVPPAQVLKRTYFNTGESRDFPKSYIINADSQMESLREAGVDLEYGFLGQRKSIKALWKAGKKIRSLCREKEIRLLHVLWGSTAALMAVFMSPVPVVISFSGSDLLGAVDSKGRITKGGILSRFVSQLAALGASQIITKSEQMKNTLWVSSRKKCTVIPNGVDLSSFKEMNQAEARRMAGWENESGKIMLFMHGGSAIVKNLPLAEATFKALQPAFPQLSMKILTKASFDRMIYYYNASDLMLMTSFHEGSNNSIKEAMACNLPIVSVNCGDAKERLSEVHNCHVVDRYDAGLLAAKASEILSGNSRSNGRNFTHGLSIPYIAGKIIIVYKLILGNTR